jgi:hypothetical protein
LVHVRSSKQMRPIAACKTMYSSTEEPSRPCTNMCALDSYGACLCEPCRLSRENNSVMTGSSQEAPPSSGNRPLTDKVPSRTRLTNSGANLPTLSLQLSGRAGYQERSLPGVDGGVVSTGPCGGKRCAMLKSGPKYSGGGMSSR